MTANSFLVQLKCLKVFLSKIDTLNYYYLVGYSFAYTAL